MPRRSVENRATLFGLLAERDFGPDPVTLTAEDRRLPFGANYAVRAAVQRHHPYDPHLGVGPGQKRLGEETAVLHAILRTGGGGFWVPESRVRHIIPEARQSLDYVRIFQQSVGETWAYLSQSGAVNFMGPPIPPGGRRTLGAPNWLWHEALTHRFHYAVRRRGEPSARWLHHWLQYGYFRGAIEFFRRDSARAPCRLKR